MPMTNTKLILYSLVLNFDLVTVLPSETHQLMAVATKEASGRNKKTEVLTWVKLNVGKKEAFLRKE